MYKIDQNLKIIVNILNKEQIFYWIGQGSLLGIKRDNKLIEWDHDIDICIWNEDNSREEVIKILEKEGFKYRKDLEISNISEQMSFDKEGGRRVDINFYQKGNTAEGEKIAFIKWTIPKNFLMQLIDAISYSDTYDSKFRTIIRKLKFLKPFAIFLKKFLIKKNFFYRNAGYQQPLNLLNKFTVIDFHNLKLNIPTQSEEYLEYLYGSDWRIPNRKFSWWKVKNLKKEYD